MTVTAQPLSPQASTSVRLRELFLSGIGGNGGDYAEFLRQLVPIIRRLIRHKLSDSEVDDVAQEVLISVHKARHTYDGGRQLMPWLYAIIQFRLNDHLREHYWQRYGATLLGLVRHHGTDPEHFLHHTHQIPDLEARLIAESLKLE